MRIAFLALTTFVNCVLNLPMGAKPSRGPADILLELLGKVPDAATLELLLDPKHLRVLLRDQGVPDVEIRRELAGGSSPGELLLRVLAREPDTGKLLATLGNPKVMPSHRNAAAFPAVSLVLGLVLAVPSAWYLFVRLDVIHVPGLIRYFPSAYALYFSVLVLGLFFLVKGVLGLVRPRV